MRSYLNALLLLAALPVLGQSRFSRLPATPPNGSVLVAPSVNSCNTQLDWFYQHESGVQSYWPLCGLSISGTSVSSFYGIDLYQQKALHNNTGTIYGVTSLSGDNETAAQVKNDTSQFSTTSDLSLNKYGGVIGVTVNSSATATGIQSLIQGTATAGGYGTVGFQTYYNGAQFCFRANLTTASAAGVVGVPACGYNVSTTHRLIATWSATPNGTGPTSFTFYVDNVNIATVSANGLLDNQPYKFTIFPGAVVGGQTTLSKFIYGHNAWNATQVAADFTHIIPTIPTAGVFIDTTQQLGTLHATLAGMSFGQVDLSSAPKISTVLNALKYMGIKLLRYAGGSDNGIESDYNDWHPSATIQCYPFNKGQLTNGSGTFHDYRVEANNTIDTFIPNIVQPLGATVNYVVNYGTNPPTCNVGGNAQTNAGDLAAYMALHYPGIVTNYAIGNEQFDPGSCGNEADLHTNPYANGCGGSSSYGTYEPAFYDAIKAADANAKVAIMGTDTPIGNFYVPTFANAKWDWVDIHLYPVIVPSDGSLLYPERAAGGTVNLTGTLLNAQAVELNYGKQADEIAITEYDGIVAGSGVSASTFSIAQPIFLVDTLLQFATLGIKQATYWELGCDSVPHGTSSGAWLTDGSNSDATTFHWSPRLGSGAPVYLGGSCPGGESETTGAKMNYGDYYPVAHGFALLNQSGILAEGEHMLSTWLDSDNAPWLKVYGATHGTGHYEVVLINRDRDSAHTVPVSISGLSSGSGTTEWTYGIAQFNNTASANWNIGPVTTYGGSWTGTANVVVPPLSVKIILF